MISRAAAPASARGATAAPASSSAPKYASAVARFLRIAYRVERDVGEEAERALGAHHQAGEDVGGPVELEEGLERVGHGVLGA